MTLQLQCGIDRIATNPDLIQHLGRIGLVVNQTSVASWFEPSVGVIEQACLKTKGSRLSVLFGPQHGYGQTEQDNMKETPDGFFRLQNGTQIPLFSLYSETRLPTESQLDMVDTLVVDLQDIGCRVYTYMLTLAGCLKMAAKNNKKVVVLDRVNPLGLCSYNEKERNWDKVEGHCLQKKWHSFVGWYEIPMRHGLSMGELGHYFIWIDGLTVDYQVISVSGLSRQTPLSVLKNQPWTMPSPNIPNWLSAFCFPAFVALEGCNVSEGRGTTLPFQLIGAPWLDVKLCQKFLMGHWELFSKDVNALMVRPHEFRPTFNKYQGVVCKGIQIHPLSLESIDLFSFGMVFLAFCAIHHPKDFVWSSPGYEYNTTDLPIHLILGNQSWHDVFVGLSQGQDVWDDFLNLLIEGRREAGCFIEQLPKHCFLYH